MFQSRTIYTSAILGCEIAKASEKGTKQAPASESQNASCDLHNIRPSYDCLITQGQHSMLLYYILRATTHRSRDKLFHNE